MRVFVSADDLGLTQATTDGILESFDRGLLHSTSVLAAGQDFDRALGAWRERDGLALTVHLNLMEGPPVAAAKDVKALLNERGEMAHSFVGMLKQSMTLKGAERARLKEALTIELEAQIEKVATAVGGAWRPRLDGHQHYHMIPIVLEVLLELHERWNFAYMRTLEEPLFWLPELGRALPNYCGANLAKHAILKPLARKARRALDAHGIEHCRWFVGLLFSGNMTIEPVRAAARHLERRAGPEDIVEFLLHPGRATDAESTLWRDREELSDYYCSRWRDQERATLCAGEFRGVLAPHLMSRAPGS